MSLDTFEQFPTPRSCDARPSPRVPAAPTVVRHRGIAGGRGPLANRSCPAVFHPPRLPAVPP